jgi:hypothetical protein
MSSKIENILEKLRDLLAAACDADIRLDDGLPDKIPPDGLVIIYEGDPGEPDIALGGFSSAYYQQDIEIAVHVQHGDPETRRQKFYAILRQIGQVLEDHPTLDGLIQGREYGSPQPEHVPAEGAAPIKAATLIVTVDYETDAPLS